MLNSIDRFEKYMDKPNLVYFMMGVIFFFSGTYIALNPIMSMHFSPTFEDIIANLNSTPIVSLVFNSWFYWIVGTSWSGGTIIYWLLNGWIR